MSDYYFQFTKAEIEEYRAEDPVMGDVAQALADFDLFATKIRGSNRNSYKAYRLMADPIKSAHDKALLAYHWLDDENPDVYHFANVCTKLLSDAIAAYNVQKLELIFAKKLKQIPEWELVVLQHGYGAAQKLLEAFEKI